MGSEKELGRFIQGQGPWGGLGLSSRGSGRHWVVLGKVMIWSDLHFNKITLALLVKCQLILTPWKASFLPCFKTAGASIINIQWQFDLKTPCLIRIMANSCAKNINIIQIPHQRYPLGPVHYGNRNWAGCKVLIRTKFGTWFLRQVSPFWTDRGVGNKQCDGSQDRWAHLTPVLV